MTRRVIITFKAPSDIVEKLDRLIARGVFSSRSEALRRALVMLIQQYEGLNHVVESEAERGGNRGFEKAKRLHGEA